MAAIGSSIPVLVGTNFNNWFFRISSILEKEQVKSALEKDPPTDETEKKNFFVMDSKAKAIIIQGTSDKHLDLIMDCPTAKSMIKALKDVFVRSTAFSKLTLWRKLINLKYSLKDSMEDHFLVFDSIMRDLQEQDSGLTETDKVCHLMLSLPEEFSAVVTALETVPEVKMDFVRARLLDEELKLKTASQGCGSRDEVSFKAHSGCFICGDKRHYKAQCPRNRFSRENKHLRGNFRGKKKGKIQGNIAEANEEVVLVALNCDDNKLSSNNVLIVDSGASNHLFKSELEPFMCDVSNLDREITIHIANGDKMVSRKMGNLRVSCQGQIVNIKGLIVNGLKHNLLSVSAVTSKGLKVITDSTGMKICGNSFELSCTRVNGLYVLSFDDPSSVSCNLSARSCENLWHRRLGHLNRHGLKILGLPSSDGKCSACIEGKATRQPFFEQQTKTKQVGELIHSDLVGPFNPESIEGHRFMQVILDDFTHFVVVKLLHKKSEAEGNLINFIAELERQQGVPVKRLRLDNGGEFTSNSFKKFCLTRGIRLEYTLPYSSQMGGKSERMNRTVLNMVRTKISDSGIPKFLWGEAARCSAYELNRSPTSTLDKYLTPSVLWNGRNDVSKLRVFGCRAWPTVIPKGSRLDPRSKEGVMVGYCGGGYRIWLPNERRIVRSRDVTFDETQMPYKQIKSVPIYQDSSSFDDIEGEKKKEIGVDSEVSKNSLEEVDRTGNGAASEDSSRPQRIRSTPNYLSDYELYNTYCMLSTSEEIPSTYEAASRIPEWQEAVNKELEAHKKMCTWIEEEAPDGEVPISTKWVYTIKEDGRKKARLVARGFQEHTRGEESFNYSPVCRIDTVRILLSFACQNNWRMKQVDVPTAFLNGIIDYPVYIKTPEGVNSTNKSLKLNRALYGLKKAPKFWNERFNSFMVKLGFVRSNYDFCLYHKKDVFLVLFVDDAIITGNDKAIDDLLNNLRMKFKVREMNVSNFLGMKIELHEKEIKITQTRFIEKLIETFNMQDCKKVLTPMEAGFKMDLDSKPLDDKVPYRSLVCGLMYLSTTTRPDLSFPVSFLARYLDKTTHQTWKAAKRILRYLKETKHLGLIFRQSDTHELVGYSDADWAGDHQTRRSVSGFVAFYGGNPIAWHSRKQACVALSTMEAEYIAAGMACQELVNLCGVVSEFCNAKISGKLVVDNTSAIALIKTCENSKRAKHIDIKYHFVKDLISKNLVYVQHINSENNVADLFTKALGADKFQMFRKTLVI